MEMATCFKFTFLNYIHRKNFLFLRYFPRTISIYLQSRYHSPAGEQLSLFKSGQRELQPDIEGRGSEYCPIKRTRQGCSHPRENIHATQNGFFPLQVSRCYARFSLRCCFYRAFAFFLFYKMMNIGFSCPVLIPINST